MKKLYTAASILMLALSMSLTTACSNDNDLVTDKPVAPEQPAEGLRIVTLRATADMGAETRVVTEGMSGKDDAFRITGWKDGDVVKVMALKNDGSKTNREILFTYNASTREFTGSVPNEFELNDLAYAYVGGGVAYVRYPQYEDWSYFEVNTPIAITNPEDCFLCGKVIVDDDAISAILTAPYALACVHNNTEEDIEVGQITADGIFLKNYLSYRFKPESSLFVPDLLHPSDKGYEPLKYTVPAEGKAYFVIPPCYDYGYNYYGLYDFTHSQQIAAPKKDVTLGKVYKVQVGVLGKGTAKRTGDIDVNWVKLWAGGPKFAEYNVGAANNKAEDFGGYYCWGSSIDKAKNSSKAYNEGFDVLTGTDDTATNLWGENWRMPTQAELKALCDNCDTEPTSVNGVGGYKITGRGAYSANSIFLPAAGCFSYGDAPSIWPSGVGDSYCWSSTPDDSDSSLAYQLSFTPLFPNAKVNQENRHYGLPVRAVLVE